MSEKENSEEIIPFPYYVNQPRLIDLFSLLNDGYSEYEEISITNEKRTKIGKQIDVQGSGGFKLFNLGVNAVASHEKDNGEHTDSTTKRVQTIPTMLKLGINELKRRDYLFSVELDHPNKIKPGMFVLTPVELKINSIKSFMTEIEDLLKLGRNIEKLTFMQAGKKQPVQNNLLTQVQQMQGIVKELVSAEEAVYIADNYALVGNISDENLYQASRQDLIGTNLMCLAQIKRVFENGAPLLRNTIFAKLDNEEMKQGIISSLEQISKDNGYQFEADVVPEVQNKPVYELELIALYLELSQSIGK